MSEWKLLILNEVDVTIFQPPRVSFRAQPLNYQHVENIMKMIIQNPKRKGKVWSIGVFSPEYAALVQKGDQAIITKFLDVSSFIN